VISQYTEPFAAYIRCDALRADALNDGTEYVALYVGNTPVELVMVLLLDGIGVAVEFVGVGEETKMLLANTAIHV
jgi:hypothetical protein